MENEGIWIDGQLGLLWGLNLLLQTIRLGMHAIREGGCPFHFWYYYYYEQDFFFLLAPATTDLKMASRGDYGSREGGHVEMLLDWTPN